MTATYDLSTDIGKIRLYCLDRDIADPVFTDEELQAFLTQEGDVKLAAAAALDFIAGDMAMVLRITTDSAIGYSVNGVAAAAELRARSAALRKEVEDGGAAGGTFDVAETDWECLI